MFIPVAKVMKKMLEGAAASCNHEEESHTMRMESSRAGRQREPVSLRKFLWIKS